MPTLSKLDSAQVLQLAADEVNGALKVNIIAQTGSGASVVQVTSGDGSNNNVNVTAGKAFKVDGSATTQPISAASLPLPTGAATSANQSTEITSLNSIVTNTTGLALESGGHLASVDTKLSTINTTLGSPLQAGGIVNSRTQDGSGTAISSTSNALNVFISGGGIDVGTSDKSTFTYGTSIENPIGGVFQDTSPTLTAGQTGAVRMTTNRGFHVNLRDASGNEKLGQLASASSIPVVIASDQSALPASQSGTWNVNNVSGTVSLPTNAAQETGGHLASIDTKLTTTANGLKVDGSTVTQPVSGTVTSNIGTTNGLALDATVSNVQGSASGGTAGAKSDLSGGIFNTSAPTLTNGQQASLQLDVSGNLKSAAVQSGTWNINNVSGTVSLPTGASTSAKQPALGTAGTASTDVITIQGVAGMTAVKVDGSAVTQPISGTITANIGTTNGLALDATVSSVQGTVAAGTAATKSTLTGGVFNTSLPTLTNGQQAATQFDSSGRVIIAPVSNFPTTVDTNYGAVGANTVRTASEIGNSTGAAAFNAGTTSAQTLRVVLPTDQTSIPVTQSGTWNISNVSGTVSLPTGAATEATLAKLTLAQGSTTSGETGPLIQGAVTTAAPSYTTAQISPLSLTTAGALRTDSSSTTQPISGTVAATQSGTWTVQPGNTANTTPWLATINQGGNSATVTGANALKTDGSAVTQPISGTVISNIGTTGGITVTQGSTTSGESGPLIQGAVTTASPSYTTGNTNPLSLTTAGALRTDSSATTQPVSGTVAATQSGTWSTRTLDGSGNSINSTSNALNVSVTNASINTNATQTGTWNVRIQDSAGSNYTSTTQGTKIALYTSDVGTSLSEFVRNDYSSVNVTTAAYTTLVASTSNIYEVIEIFDSSGQTLKIAFGAAASEVDKFLVFPGGNTPIKFHVPLVTRISIKAVSATASVGELSMNFYG